MKKVLLYSIKTYQQVSATRKPCCRYFPTCSEYSFSSIEKFGVLKGSWYTIKRVLRCNPFGSFGYDPVPDK